MSRRYAVWLGLALLACGTDHTGAGAGGAGSAGAAARDGAPVAPAPGDASGDPADPIALSAGEFSRLFRELSEPSREFYGDNSVSNELSYLQIAAELDGRARGDAYLGVGPEQNFSYIALSRPRLAFVVDLRRGNALLQLLYKALFELCDSRSDFLASLLGRRPPTGDLAGLTVAELVERVEAMPRDEQRYRRIGGRVVGLLGDLGLGLSEKDLAHIERLRRLFFERQLDLKFEWNWDNGHNYPTLRALLLATDPDGATRGFLASEDGYRAVRDLERQHRIIPVVGDLAGSRALPGIATELARRQLPLAVFYVSNVEQYLMKSRAQWQSWQRNIERFALADDAVFVRSYLAGERRHPAQLPGHRTATVVQPIARMLENKEYRSYLELTTEP